ncbi:RteC domain-containing protein [Pedobacter jamesrossensis]|uniref:RteC domain-containing protein n=1 Tax=Pedobacter jamesrossensis TaxID=1908238 RepID=A0ABV8NRM2_9SPHI
MLSTQCEKIYLEMTSKLHQDKAEPVTNLQRLSSSLTIIESAIIHIHSLVKSIGFASDDEEVQFFKVTKPKFYSWKIFLVEQYNIIDNIPVDTSDRVRNYYVKEIDFLQRYFDQNQFLYHYYLGGQVALDKDYFLRRNYDSLEAKILSGEFETKGDYIFAKFRAYKLLKEFLLTRIRLIYSDPESSVFRFLAKGSELHWTDDKIKLVELAYGIYFMGSLNDGKADISQVVDVLERTLNVDLGVVYRKFIDITRRKSKGYTYYLDSMRNAINDHIAAKHGR